MEKLRSSKIAHWSNKLAVASEPGLTTAQLMLYNHDLKPVEPERRQWGAWNFVGFWVADSFNINTWMISSSNIVDGLSWWQSWICVWLGYSIAACFVCMTGRIGATYHISFPIVNRASFGIWGALWPVFNRAAMACIWYGVQAWIGGTCVYLMIRCSANLQQDEGNGDGGILNGIPNSGTNTVAFVSFFLFWVGSLPFIYPPVHKIRHLFTVKAYVVLTAGIAFLIWAIVRAKGIGPIVHQPGTAKGSALGWLMVRGIMSAIANFATLIANDPDFARFARKPSDALLPQLLTIPIGFAVTSFIGIIVSSSSAVIFGEAIWNPLNLLESFLKEEGAGAGQRFGVLIIAAAFTLAQLGTNIAAKSISAGTDMTALAPRWISIRRGDYVCALVGIVIFTTYLSAYSVFLSSIAGVMISDHYMVRKGYLQIKDLYSGKRTGPYYYTLGFYWRGYAAYIAGVAINLVCFVGAIGKPVPIGARRIYDLNFFAGFLVASISYWALCKISPIPATSDTWMEVGDEITDISVAYHDNGNDRYDEEVMHGGNGKGAEEPKGEAVHSKNFSSAVRRLAFGLAMHMCSFQKGESSC
ncbi:NCS1 nucleoside transporter family [Setomelanomma holmii]|uniref:NCS1 nucleoside transporter family n=1 Tax=Setomelanomma holmii TaxID=210430 RepID=A0A9P4LNZ7_9PLEO|nr:NCS1 nucleoside transporter family [Setomelanomma holmii]